ncbi:mitotic fidelity of chromosome transmission- protein [Malassezia vespertilionis]|uniref:CENP-C homolog n=1 Tax=Malassezia vespertilionis TaxID=2020962 RepID=A0A2N1J7M2_9BASI|nr:mitotic fidelity of chromosome transmission- protein [Malassezia vespertilionis]PKI82551.1 hypothetical protein MVES_003372 [Malassezia vespertilionis]WFD08439.1 mitotic fidelity of chromosome transmission- protein [Malassezia vespertilionis]
MSTVRRRFHEEGLGSRTGLRIGAVRKDSQGNEDIDAFFAESKRVLDWMDHSDEESESTVVSAKTRQDDQGGVWDDRVQRLSAWAAGVEPAREEVSRTSAIPAADASMWESSIDGADRTFDLTGLAGDVPSSPMRAAQDWRADSTERWDRRASGARDRDDWREDADWLGPRSERTLVPLRRDTLAPMPDMSGGTSFLHESFSQSALDSDPASLDSVRDTASPQAPPFLRDETPLAMPDVDASDAGMEYDAYEEMPEPPPKKRGRGRPRKSETLRAASSGAAYVASNRPRGQPGRPPGRQMAPQKIVEQIHDPPSWQLQSPDGLRRGKRHRIPPLDWWRGERALYGRTGANENAPLLSFGMVAPVLKEVVRVPRRPDEGTFAGMRRFKPKPAGYQGPGRPPLHRQPTEHAVSSARHAEPGMDEETDPFGQVYDADQGMDVTMRIACTSSDMRPRPAFNQQFLYEKVFSLGEFMAAGVLVIPGGGEKPTKPSKDNNYAFFVFQGAVEVMVHRTRFVIASGGMFLIPKENMYNIRNVGDNEARIFFAQARNLSAPLTTVVHQGRPVFSHGQEHVDVEEGEGEEEAPSQDEFAPDDSDPDEEYDISRESRRSHRSSGRW